MPANPVTFGQFRLDAANECLWQGTQAIPVRPKPFAVLTHLVDHHGQLVTKQQLLDAVWPATFVTDAVLKDSIRQLREALGDDAASPRYIETAHRRGYRFIAPISSSEEAPREPRRLPGPAVAASSAVGVLGRETELSRMRGCLEQALRGERQTVFVTGEPGIGKTTLVNAALEQAAAVPGIWVARGQCLEQYGAGEAYLPVLDGFSRLGRAPGGERIVELLRRHAPAWLLELPSLNPPAERATAPPSVGATRERMLREMAEAVEAMTVEAPVVLALEDLHWSDYSTLDLIAYLARRRDPARLMVIGTYRPVDLILSDHPLKGVKRELQAHGLCQELALDYLTEEAVGQYLDARFAGHRFPKRLGRLIHRRSEGNPLFMVNLVEFLVDEGVIGEDEGHALMQGELADIDSSVPDSIKQLIERQVERLSPDERRVLSGASVVGMECSATAIAAGLDEQTAWVDEQCEALVRRHQFLSPPRLVELPDGTITSRYKFSHVLYLDVPYGLLPPMRRAQIHGRIGQSGEAIYGDRVGEIAAELAMHFEQARDMPRAVKYLLQAAENATHRSAQHEAAGLASRGLSALASLPDSPGRAQQEIALRVILGVSVMAIKGFAAAEVEEVYRRALTICAQQGPSTQSFMVHWLLGLFHYFRAEMQPAHETARQLLAMAVDLDDSFAVIEANRAIGVTLVDLGRFDEALNHLDNASALYDIVPYRAHASFAGQDPKVVSECFAARAHWALGNPDRAMERLSRGVSLAHSLSHPESQVVATHFAAHLHQLRGEPSETQERAETVIALADEYGLELWVAFGHIHRGWALAEQGQVDEGIQELRRGLADYEATGARLWRAHFLGLLAQAFGRAGLVQEGLSAAADALALVDQTGENFSTAELYRVQGELLLLRGADGNKNVARQAGESFERALSIARAQGAIAWERRADMSLNRVLDRRA